MSKILITMLLAPLLAGPAWPQDEQAVGAPGEPDAAAAVADGDADPADEADKTDEAHETGADEVAAKAAEEAEEADTIVDPGFEDTDLDVQTYEEDDDDFVPSEEIPADEPIPFPSNI